jgi:hypothetical protein
MGVQGMRCRHEGQVEGQDCEEGARALSVISIKLAIEARIRNMLGRRGGAGIRNVLRRRCDEAAYLSSTLMQGIRSAIATIWGD